MVRAVVRASLTSNLEKSLKKKETALDFCISLRFFGSFGLSRPIPPADEQNCPVQRRGARRRLLHTAAARGALRAARRLAARRLAGRCARLS